VSADDNSDFEESLSDLDELILEVLSSGPKFSDDLYVAVMKKVSVNERTYYRHLEKLRKQEAIEMGSENDSTGKLIHKYTLKPQPIPKVEESPMVLYSPAWEEVVPARRYLEIAAWLKREPEGWPMFEAVAKAKQLLEGSLKYLVPQIEVSCEDPDAYAFVWSSEPCRGHHRGNFVQSRFFKLKGVFGSVAESSDLPMIGGDVYVAVFGSEVVAEQFTVYANMESQIVNEYRPMELRVSEEPFSVCVAVSKQADGVLRVVYVEGKSGNPDKAWVKGVSNQLGAKASRILSFAGLKDDVKRSILLKLRSVLEKRKLAIPNRYVKLVEEMLDYSYKNPSSGYVHTLALAVDLAQPQTQ
jgi:hypothetical protein